MKNILDPLYFIHALLLVFMIGLILSGLSAIALQWEIGILEPLLGSGSGFSQFLSLDR